MTQFKLSRRVAAIAIAAGLTFAGAPFAGAQVTTAPAPPTAGAEGPLEAAENADLVDPAAPVTLTINKFIGSPGDTSTPGEGAEFVIERVNDVDLTTQAGWATASAIAAGTQDPSGFTVVDTIETGSDGVATITTGANANFTVGMYRVSEQSSAGFSTAPPFYITLPHSENGAWSYEQTVEPKNQQLVPSKQVDDTNATIGSTINYTINVPIPAGAANATWDRLNVEDNLVDGLTLNGAPVVTAVAGDGTETVLTAGTHYNVVPGTDANSVRIEFTAAGRDAIRDLRLNDPSLVVTIGLSATINSLPADGLLTNTANIEYPNGAEADTDGDEGPTSTQFAPLIVTKTTPEAGGDTLNGAVFELYQCNAQNELLGDALTMATTPTGAPETTVETTGGDDNGSDATANAYGIPVSSYAAGAGDVANRYCVLETAAPAGYIRNPEPQYVELVNGELTVEVENQRDSFIGQLPATGAWGILLIFLVGAALLARGIYTSYRDNRATA